MTLWSCDFESCEQPAAHTIGDCILCNRHLCIQHLDAETHSCPKWEDIDGYHAAEQAAREQEFKLLLEKLTASTLEKLCTRASSLRDGIPCTVQPLRADRATRESIIAGMNYHIDITFDDGTTWTARLSRLRATTPPAALLDAITRSEVATLKFLERTAVPAPRVHDFLPGQHPDNPLGTMSFILTDKLPGQPLRLDQASPEQTNKVLSQIADVFAELARHPFGRLGSLDDPDDPSHVGALAQAALADCTRAEGLRRVGPFDSAAAYYSAEVRLHLDRILRGETAPHRAVDAYLVHLFLRDLVPRVAKAAAAVPPPGQSDADAGSKFYLKHALDTGPHILVSDDFAITGITGWQSAHTAPAAHAFSAPAGLLPVADFYAGKNELGQHEEALAQLLLARDKGRADLATYVRAGRLQQRFAFCCGADVRDWEWFVGLFGGLRDLVGVDGGMGWEEWKGVAVRRYGDDEGLRRLLGEVGSE